MRTPMQGFTLIEMLTAMAIAAVLSGVALPSFEGQLQKARRADVLAALVLIQGAQERLRSRSTRYGELAEIGAAGVTRAGHYTLQMTAFDADGYVLLATATGTQARDVACRFMRASAVGMNLVYASGSDISVANDRLANRQCWSL
ncbi:MAG: type IV pilin protein [Burkholderiales bacterium]